MFQIRLKELREVRKLSQAKLADALGVRQSTVAMWENGKNKPEFDTLTRIADFFNVSVDDLLNKTETKKAPVESDKGDRPAMEREFIDLLSTLNPESVAELKSFMSLSPEQRKAVLALVKATGNKE